MVIEIGSQKSEVVLPIVSREYVNPKKFNPFFRNKDSDGETHQEEVDLNESRYSTLISLKDLYHKAITKRFGEVSFGEVPDDAEIEEIFEIGLNYLGGLVKLCLDGCTSIQILDKNRAPTKKALNVEGVLVNVRTEREKSLHQHYEERKAYEDMEKALSSGLDKLKVYHGNSTDMKLIVEKRKMREDISRDLKTFKTYCKRCPDMMSPEERKRKQNNRKEKDI